MKHCMVTLPFPILKKKGKYCMAEKPSHVSRVSLSYPVEIGLKMTAGPVISGLQTSVLNMTPCPVISGLQTSELKMNPGPVISSLRQVY